MVATAAQVPLGSCVQFAAGHAAPGTIERRRGRRRNAIAVGDRTTGLGGHFARIDPSRISLGSCGQRRRRFARLARIGAVCGGQGRDRWTATDGRVGRAAGQRSGCSERDCRLTMGVNVCVCWWLGADMQREERSGKKCVRQGRARLQPETDSTEIDGRRGTRTRIPDLLRWNPGSTLKKSKILLYQQKVNDLPKLTTEFKLVPTH